MQNIAFIVVITLALGYFGGALVSFLTVAITRGRQGESPNGRSRCKCGRPLKWRENVPVFGFIVNRLRGGAPCCKSKVPAYMFATELTGFIGWAVFGLFVTLFAMMEVAVIGLVAAAAVAVVSLVVAAFIVYSADKKGNPSPAVAPREVRV